MLSIYAFHKCSQPLLGLCNGGWVGWQDNNRNRTRPHQNAIAMLRVTLPYLTLPYLTLPSLTLPYLTLPYLTLPYLTLPYLTLAYPSLA